MERLALAIAIVDLVERMSAEGRPIDVERAAARLVEQYPGATRGEVAATIRQELAAAGRCTGRARMPVAPVRMRAAMGRARVVN